MKLPKEFEYYIKKGIIKKRSPDKSRAEFLYKEAETSLKGLKKRVEVMQIDNLNANSIIKDCYDIIMELVRSKMLLSGFSASGSFAHEGEIAYLKNLKIPDTQISFLNELRYFRNSINYYGKIFDKEYAEKVYGFLNKVIGKLK